MIVCVTSAIMVTAVHCSPSAMGVPRVVILPAAPPLPHHHAGVAGVCLRAGGARGAHAAQGVGREEWRACCQETHYHSYHKVGFSYTLSVESLLRVLFPSFMLSYEMNG